MVVHGSACRIGVINSNSSFTGDITHNESTSNPRNTATPQHVGCYAQCRIAHPVHLPTGWQSQKQQLPCPACKKHFTILQQSTWAQPAHAEQQATVCRKLCHCAQPNILIKHTHVQQMARNWREGCCCGQRGGTPQATHDGYDGRRGHTKLVCTSALLQDAECGGSRQAFASTNTK
jgi:hypothetical protein